MAGDRPCPTCGQLIPFGQSECPSCSERKGTLWSLEREAFVLLPSPALVAFFIVTGFAARAYHSKEKHLADEWYARGEANLGAGRPASALDDFRTALIYSRDNPRYQFRLARALLESDRIEEARVYLLNLWEHEPGNGAVNLELGRLAARQGNVHDAQRYFHNAIYGVWESQRDQQRREARRELAEVLLSKGEKTQARAELVALVAELPADAALHVRAGKLFLEAEDFTSALQEFRNALKFNRRKQGALAGAGEAAFRLARYREAKDYLERAMREHPRDPAAASLLKTTHLVLGADPSEPGLTPLERARRVKRAFAQAGARLRKCAAKKGEALDVRKPVTDLQASYARARKLRPRVGERYLLRRPGLGSTVMDFVFNVEEQTAKECGPPAGVDEALMLIGRRRGEPEH